ncbi:TPA: hypothetical protein ACTW9D_005461 [Klebsiella pneumoniae]
MAELNPPLGTPTPEIFLDNVKRADRLVNGPAATVPDRAGDPLDSWRQIMAMVAAAIVEAQNSITAIGLPFATLAEAQAAADDGKIPVGAVAWVRSTDGSSLADEYMNVGGTLQATGRKMLSAENINALVDAIYERIAPLQTSPDSLFDIVSANGLRPFLLRDTDGVTELEMIARLVTGAAGLNFSGCMVDFLAPTGWLFVIYAANGLVVAGVKDDGTKVGWGDGSSSGGGQSGEIIPGDTTVSYDAIRQYDGESTVKDVVGLRIAGRFVVDAADTTSRDDAGGILVDALGRRWKRQADYVSFDMFGAPRVPESVYQQFAVRAAQGDHEGAAAVMANQPTADAQIAACFDFAARMNIPVRQNDGRFLWQSGEFNIYTDTDLSGATIITTDISGVNEDRWGPIPGLDDDAPQPVRMLTICSRKPRVQLTSAQIAALNTTYARYLKAGSCQLPMPDLYPYRGGLLFIRSSAIKYYRNGDTTNPRQRVLYRDFSRIGKNGALTDMLVENIPEGTVVEAFIVPKEDSYLRFIPPFFHESGNSRRFFSISVYRPQAIIGKMSLRTDAYGEAAAWTKISANETFDLEFQGGQCDGAFSYSGAYVLSFRDCINMQVRDFTGMYGWGVNGHHGTKKIYFRDCTMNRIDWHTFGYDVFGENIELKGNGINMHGGGTWRFKALTAIIPSDNRASRGEAKQNYFIQLREDYAADCNGILDIDGLTIKFDVTDAAAFSASTASYDILRLVGTQTTNDRHDTRTPNRIDIRNVTVDCQGLLNFTAAPGNFSLVAVRSVRSERIDTASTGYKTYLPEFIRVEGMTAINVPSNQNIWMSGIRFADGLFKNTVGSRTKKRADGTNADIVLRDIRSVVNNPVCAIDVNNTVWLPGNSANWTADYRSSDYSWVPHIQLDNCIPAIIETRGAMSVISVSGGVLARYLNGNSESRLRVTGADIQLYPDAANTLYFDAVNAAAVGCSWLNPAGGALYIGTLRGAANENRGDAIKAPNIPSSVFF